MSLSVVVTGSNKGIGLALVKQLASRANVGRVFLGSRDAGRGAAALATLTAEQRGRVSLYDGSN